MARPLHDAAKAVTKHLRVLQKSGIVCVRVTAGSNSQQWGPAVHLETNMLQHKESMTMTRTARGAFDVKVTPMTAPDAVPVRLTLEKRFHGELEGTSKGEMLAVGSGAPGSSGGYVALEKVAGTLAGHKGPFVLQHSGTMTRGSRFWHCGLYLQPAGTPDIAWALSIRPLSGRK